MTVSQGIKDMANQVRRSKGRVIELPRVRVDTLFERTYIDAQSPVVYGND
jgi:hypothetical protein